MFEDFVAAWNGRRLPARYYKGEVGGAAQRTSHQWGIKGGQWLVMGACLLLAVVVSRRRVAGWRSGPATSGASKVGGRLAGCCTGRHLSWLPRCTALQHQTAHQTLWLFSG